MGRQADTWEKKKKKIIHVFSIKSSFVLLSLLASTSNEEWPSQLWSQCLQLHKDWHQHHCTLTSDYNLHLKFTFEKSGGGFFPLHKLDSAQTRFFVIDSLEDCFKSLKKKKKKKTYFKGSCKSWLSWLHSDVAVGKTFPQEIKWLKLWWQKDQALEPWMSQAWQDLLDFSAKSLMKHSAYEV